MTRYAEVIGDPISHSKSPLIHNFWLEKLGLDAEYRSCHVKPEELEDYFSDRRADSSWLGCNITLPHKVAALEFVSDPGGVRGSIGAVNTVFRGEQNNLIGTNTDAGGFYLPIANMNLIGQTAIVVGAGGAARAVLFALKQAGIGNIILLARNGLKAAGILAQLGIKGEILPMDCKLPPAALLVNTSPLGMTGQLPLEIDLTPLPEDAVVYDIVYTPIETQLLKAARGRRLETVDGLGMFIGQAALAFELFFGAAPPEDHDDELRQRLLG